MVGDHATADVGGGRAAGLKTAWLHRGREWTEVEFRPDVIVGSVPDVARHLERASSADRPPEATPL
jgi:putative hydrolase of the HAD superfamily